MLRLHSVGDVLMNVCERWWCDNKGENLEQKPVFVELCPRQIPHRKASDRTWYSAVNGQRLIARTMAQPRYDIIRCDML
jgi:hypothetical protein